MPIPLSYPGSVARVKISAFFLFFPSFRHKSPSGLYSACVTITCVRHHSRPQSLRSFWPAAGIESSGSNRYERTKEITEFWLSGSLRICINGAGIRLFPLFFHNGCSQSSRFLPQARRIEGSGDENGSTHEIYRSCRRATSSDSMISRAMKSHTNEHTVRGRPTL